MYDSCFIKNNSNEKSDRPDKPDKPANFEQNVILVTFAED